MGNISDMRCLKPKVRVAIVLIITVWIGLAGIYSLLKPISNGCVMTYMYPTYIPIPTPENVSSTKYGLYLYHEGWRKIDFNDRIKKLNGIPVLFIPGNGGSYKQVRSLGAESDRAYQGGPPASNFDEALANLGEIMDVDLKDIPLPNKYITVLDWFAVDLEGEQSAMDGRIVQEHSEYVVYAIHRILDQYKESYDARVKHGASVSRSPPKSVILVGHSMGGFVARAAVVHPNLRKFAVETVVTLSTPHQSPPVPLQPSLGHYYESVNQEWRKGYEAHTSQTRLYLSNLTLSHVVVVSISGGYNDYQVRTKLESLDGIVPPTHGFMISSTSIKNVWLSMEHQVILWCNQLVMQVSHTLLSVIDKKTGQPFSDARTRLAIFAKILQSGIPKSFISRRNSHLIQQTDNSSSNGKSDSAIILKHCDGILQKTGLQVLSASFCENNGQWNEDELERDLYIQTNMLTVLAMDGRRRWLDIQKLDPNRKKQFVFVTNLLPCSGVRLHLWPEKKTSASEFSTGKRVVEVTSKMVQIPSGPAQRQIEPGSQTEQAPPSAVFWLGPQDMLGFKFLTISVAPAQTVSGRPPPAASMGVGQFFDPNDGKQAFSPYKLIHSVFSEKEFNMKEDHPIAFHLTFSISLGLFPLSFSTTATGCGIKKSEFLMEDSGDLEANKVCRRRCFPPVALAWDVTSGLHVFPNLYSETLIVDSSPSLWTSSEESDETAVLLLVDPHCSYKTTVGVSLTSAAGRFLLLYFSKICGLCFAIVFFALMHQAYAWELDKPIPSVLSAVESNLRTPRPFLFLVLLPIFSVLLFSFLASQTQPRAISFSIISILCYVFANGIVVVLILLSQSLFYVAGNVHVFIRKRLQAWEGNFYFSNVQWFSNTSSTFAFIKVIKILQLNMLLVTSLVAVAFVCLVHPALGLFVFLLSHALCCHSALSSILMASFRSHISKKESYISGSESNSSKEAEGTGSPGSARSYCDTQLEIFHHQHGLLVLHLLAAFMFVPSLVAWFQRIGIGESLPWFWDSALCTGIILHALSVSRLEFDVFVFPITGIPSCEIRLSFAYAAAGYFSYLSALALAPYRVFYAMATIGIISFTFRIIERKKRKNGERHHRTRKHSHRH